MLFSLYTKKRGSLTVARPTHWGSGIALSVERATPKPTPIWNNQHSCLLCYNAWRQGMDTSYPWTSLLLCSWLIDEELPDSNASSSKRQVTPFLYIGSHFICPPCWWVLVLELLQSYKIILKYYKYSGEFFQKKYVCTRTRTHIVFIALKFA